MNKIGMFMNFWDNHWRADYRYYIDKMKKLGFDILEFQAQPLLEMDDEDCLQIHKYAETKNIELSYSLGLNRMYDISSRDKDIRIAGISYLQKIVRKIALMKGSLFSGVTFAGWGIPADFVDPKEKEDMLYRSVESMKQVIKVAENEGVTICVEAVNRYESALINTADEAMRYMDMIESPNIGIHLDTFHMNIEEDSISGAIKKVGKRIRHFHIGENNRNVPGRGHMDWEEIFSALGAVEYSGNIVAEPFLMMGDEVGYDIRVWRPILQEPTEHNLDREAIFMLGFVHDMLTKYIIKK